MKDDYCALGEDVSGDLEGLVCAWKATLNDNLNGKGTSFNPSNLSVMQKRCYHCTGFNYECKAYIVVGERE